MARCIDVDVKDILGPTAIEDTTPYIRSANILITKVLGAEDLTAAHMKEIEIWLSAHFASMQDPKESEVQIDRTRAKFDGQTGLGLDFTRFGQQVKILDTTGLLAALDTAATAGRRQGKVTVADKYEDPDT